MQILCFVLFLQNMKQKIELASMSCVTSIEFVFELLCNFYLTNLCKIELASYLVSHNSLVRGRQKEREVGGWGRVPFSKNFMKPTPHRKWYLTTGRRFHWMVLDPIPQSLPVHFFGSRPQPPTSLNRPTKM